MRNRNRHYLPLMLLLLLAFGLRLHAIDQQDIWGDEAFSIWLSRQPLAQVVAGGADTHPPGYPFALALWLRATGTSPYALRSLSALQSFLLVAAIYALGKRAFSARTGLLASLLGALSPGLLFYAQETRMYSQAVLFTALSCYAFLRLLDSQPHRSIMLGYGITTVIAGYTHYYAFFIVLAQNLAMAIVLLHQLRTARRQTLRNLLLWSGAQVALILAYIPWILVQMDFLSNKASARVTEWSLATLLRITEQTLTGIAAGLGATSAQARVLTLPIALASVLGLIGALKAPPRSRAIAALLWIPIAIAWLVNPLMPFFFPRYLLVVAPAFYLLAAAGITVLARLRRPVALLATATLLLSSAIGARAYFADELHVRGRYGQMITYLAAHARADDAVLWANPLQVRIFEYYQPQRLQTYLITAGNPPTAPHTGDTLDSILSRYSRVWLVRFGNQTEYDPTDSINAFLATHASKAHFSTWDGSDLALYVSHTAASTQVTPVNFALGPSIHLTGFTVSATEVAPGDTLLLSLAWHTSAPIAERYTVFTHVLDASGRVLAQMDSEPQGGSLPTDQWSIADPIVDNYAISLPADAPPGAYTLRVGMYQWQTGNRLQVLESGEDGITLTTIEVRQP